MGYGFDTRSWILDEVNEGDEVAMDVGGYGYPNWRIATVTKKTPTGIISTSNGRKFNNDGYERGASRGSFSKRTYIQPVTDEIREKIERSDLLGKISRTKFEQLDTTQLRKICLIIGEI